AEQKKHLFERFYRLDQARSTEGSGLGLSIAQAIAEEHRGKIYVQNSEGGITFSVDLPL
ncbi:sensor histidine kinase, partial [Clostridia bacterium OttesenSCG-928-O13]|nr:sensor histidine kinase [Clostridia bacterium OttesenSCG-928-O13]